MPQGRVRRLQRMIAGLLVLAVLLFAGPQTSMASLLHGHHHHGADVAGLIVAAGDHANTAPQQGDHHQALPCCIDGHCMSPMQWLPAQHTMLLQLPHTAVMSATGPAPRLVGIVAEPSSPPPRTIG